MANTKYEYVKSFEADNKLEPLQWIVLRLECINYKEVLQPISHGRISCSNDFMVLTACDIMKENKNISLGYGYKNIFNLILQKDTTLYKRRGFKLLSFVTSLFTSCYVTHLSKCYPKKNFAIHLPIFEGSIYLFPQDQCLRDFLSREQSFCHELNLKETTIHYLVDVAKLKYSEALEKANHSSVSEKNEMLFSLCNINYNNEPLEDKKGTILLQSPMEIRDKSCESIASDKENNILKLHQDFNKEKFWENYFPLDSKTIKNSKFNLINSFHKKSTILPHTFLVVRIDGKGFHKFSELHNFQKPNDIRSLKLMTTSAEHVTSNFSRLHVAYGHSDEYSFVFSRFGHKEKEAYSLISRIVSAFTGAFVYSWGSHFPNVPLLSHPTFDSRLVLYPSVPSIRDYLSWRQADCHINNMYNTCFWKLVLDKGLSRREAEEYLNGTFSKDKLAILKEEFNVDYLKENPLFRKGTVIVNKKFEQPGYKACDTVSHSDIIEDTFWNNNPELLGETRHSFKETLIKEENDS